MNNPPLMSDEHPLGSARNPVRCFQPTGERLYLENLLGPQGQPLHYQRIGSVGHGPHGTVLDLYHVTSADGVVDMKIHMDMYHLTYHEERPVPGLRTRDAQGGG